MKSYSRDMQDLFVLKLFGENHKGYFLDIGCQLPLEGNNTILLETLGWFGIGIDFRDFSLQWKKNRRTPFILENALTCDYDVLYKRYQLPKVIDYLSHDLDGKGDRYLGLQRLFESRQEFKVITIEHDAYAGNELIERAKQRDFLAKYGYVCLASNVMCSEGPFEDWWINPKYINGYNETLFENKFPNEIINEI